VLVDSAPRDIRRATRKTNSAPRIAGVPPFALILVSSFPLAAFVAGGWLLAGFGVGVHHEPPGRRLGVSRGLPGGVSVERGLFERHEY